MIVSVCVSDRAVRRLVGRRCQGRAGSRRGGPSCSRLLPCGPAHSPTPPHDPHDPAVPHTQTTQTKVSPESQKGLLARCAVFEWWGVVPGVRLRDRGSAHQPRSHTCPSPEDSTPHAARPSPARGSYTHIQKERVSAWAGLGGGGSKGVETHSLDCSLEDLLSFRLLLGLLLCSTAPTHHTHTHTHTDTPQHHTSPHGI
jgi:hypothetical protein